ncbi:hypothetical protein KI387_024764, partial [Taxus chinensis]
VVDAYNVNGTEQWALVKEHNEVVQLEFLSLCLAKRCMECLMLRLGPLNDILVKGLFEEARRFVGFLLRKDVKAFLSLKRFPGLVSLVPFPVEMLVSTFVHLFSRFHYPPIVPFSAPLRFESPLFSLSFPLVAELVQEGEVLQTPDPLKELSFSDLVASAGRPMPPGCLMPHVMSLERGSSQGLEIQPWRSPSSLYLSSGLHFSSVPSRVMGGVPNAGRVRLLWTCSGDVGFVFFFLLRARRVWFPKRRIRKRLWSLSLRVC